MKTTTVKGQDISVLSLGTVQLGLNYGINNTGGKPSQEAANAILNRAIEKGINVLDTAGAYGDSEVVIGNWLKTIPREKRPFIVTKAAALETGSLEAVRRDLQKRVAQSKARLGLEQLDMLMLHDFDDYLKDKENIMRGMVELKRSGDVKYLGTSAYSYHNYAEIASAGFDAVQIPLNLFDWGQIENGGLKKLADSDMMIFVRSVYLQGLIFQDPEQLDPRMEFARETLIKFRALCSRYHLAPANLALSCVLSLPGVTSLVLGSEKVEQVEQNATLLEQIVQLSPEQMEEIRSNFLHTPARVLNPSMWFNAC